MPIHGSAVEIANLVVNLTIELIRLEQETLTKGDKEFLGSDVFKISLKVLERRLKVLENVNVS